jgi:HSP20 family molecular chaperone IbpA
MPGVDEGTVDVTLEKDMLTVYGTVEAGGGATYAEYETGDYKRVFTVSDEIDRDGIKATVKNGVLKLVLPKAEQAKAKKIKIR